MDAQRTRVAMHIATPAGTNLAGKTYATCLTEDPDHSTVSVVPALAGQEITDLANGSLYEHVVTVKTENGLTNVEKRNLVDAAYSAAVAKVQAAIQAKYWAWGFERDVP